MQRESISVDEAVDAPAPARQDDQGPGRADALDARSWLMDLVGVLIQEDRAIPGADRFLARLSELGRPYLIITNKSIDTQRDLSARLARLGLDVPEASIW